MEFVGARGGARGQAMVEFVIALFAIVLLVAGITDFAIMASRQSDMAATLRGEAGGDAIGKLGDDASALLPEGSPPRAITSESELAASLVGRDRRETFTLSKAWRKWVFLGARDGIDIREEVWMPPMKVRGAE